MGCSFMIFLLWMLQLFGEFVEEKFKYCIMLINLYLFIYVKMVKFVFIGVEWY